MEDINLVFGFGLGYANRLIYCEVIMQEEGYDILFNSRWIGSQAYSDNFKWIQSAGFILPQEVVDEIGDRIEHVYN